MIGEKYYMKINTEALKQIEKSKEKKQMFSRDILLSSYLTLFHDLIKFHSTSPSNDVAMFINSLNHWANDKGKGRKTKKYSPGDIVEVEFGVKYKSEISYRHSALVVENLERKVCL